MKIVFCASMAFAKEMVEIRNKLVAVGHEVELPHNTEKYVDGTFSPETSAESTANKIKDDLIRRYFEIIKKADSILVLNYTKRGVENYIGGNTLIEMAFAHVLNKKIFVLNPLPQCGYTDELVALQPVVLGGDFGKIK